MPSELNPRTQNIGENAQSVIKYLCCPCDYFPRGTDLNIVASEYNKAFSERDTGGYTPLIIVIESHMFFDGGLCSADFQKEIFSAPKIDPEKWFVKTKAEHDNGFCYDQNEIIGGISGGKTRNGFSSIIDYGINKSRECVLAKIPVKTHGKSSRGFRSAAGMIVRGPRKCCGLESTGMKNTELFPQL